MGLLSNIYNGVKNTVTNTVRTVKARVKSTRSLFRTQDKKRIKKHKEALDKFLKNLKNNDSILKKEKRDFDTSLKTMEDLNIALLRTRTYLIKQAITDNLLLMGIETKMPLYPNILKYKCIDLNKTSHNKFESKNFIEVLDKFGFLSGTFGDFVVPSSVLDEIKEARKKGQIPDNSIPQSSSLYEKAKEVLEQINNETNLNKYCLYSIIAAFFVECGWNFDSVVVNKDEQKGSGKAGTEGYSNCGECWFGLTFWRQKEAVIKKLGSIVPDYVYKDKVLYNKQTEAATAPEDGTQAELDSDGKPKHMLASVKDRTFQIKVMVAYFETCANKQYKVLCKNFQDIQNMEDSDMEEQLAASYLWKAGQGKNPTLDNALAMARTYMKSHTEDGYKNIKNGFLTQLFMAISLALYISEGKVFTPKEIDDML